MVFGLNTVTLESILHEPGKILFRRLLVIHCRICAPDRSVTLIDFEAFIREQLRSEHNDTFIPAHQPYCMTVVCELIVGIPLFDLRYPFILFRRDLTVLTAGGNAGTHRKQQNRCHNLL